MRWKFLLPALQTITMLLIVWAPWNPKAHELVVRLANGGELKGWSLIPGPDALEWAEGINLPASAVVTPVEFAIRKPDALPNYKVRLFGYWMVGLLCWNMVGRFADDLIRWRNARTLPRKHAGDLTFALIAAPSAALLGIAFNGKNLQARVLAIWGIIWMVIASTALLFRVAQVIRQRRKPAVT